MTVTDYATYIAGLPRVLAGAAVLFRDGRGRILVVEPTYREGWVLPGGTVEADAGETPRQAARRETLEEIGLDVPPGPLIAVDWAQSPAGLRWWPICTTAGCSPRSGSRRSGSRRPSWPPGS